MRVLDLFSGIGGFSLGLERTDGFKTVAFCEIEPFCAAVLRTHWPNVPCYPDVRRVTRTRLKADGIWPIDVITGGFPCQDVSTLGSRTGLRGEKSGLWKEFARVIAEITPSFVVAENVEALRWRGLDTVLRDLAAVGLDAEWRVIPAAVVGAPHQRNRTWVVAYPHQERWPRGIFRLADHAYEVSIFTGALGDRTQRGSSGSWVTRSAGPNSGPRKRHRPAGRGADRSRHPSRHRSQHALQQNHEFRRGV
jgi:DNA-cytosine methyltransferase